MRSRSPGEFTGGAGCERGSITAEFVTVVPAVLVVVALCISGIAVATQHARAQDAAAAAARSLSRGEDTGKARARAHHIIPIASLSSRAEGDMLCATVTAEGGTSGPLGWVTVTATHCALGGGQ